MLQLGHINLRTQQLEAMATFYSDILGFAASQAETRPGSKSHIWLRDPQGRPAVHLQQAESPAPVDGASDCVGFHHVAFDAEQPDEWAEKLSARGVPFTRKTFDSAGLEQINLSDPDGTRIELVFVVDPSAA